MGDRGGGLPRPLRFFREPNGCMHNERRRRVRTVRCARYEWQLRLVGRRTTVSSIKFPSHHKIKNRDATTRPMQTRSKARRVAPPTAPASSTTPSDTTLTGDEQLLTDLPADALHAILSHLPLMDLCLVAETCTTLRDVAHDDSRKHSFTRTRIRTNIFA